MKREKKTEKEEGWWLWNEKESVLCTFAITNVIAKFKYH